MKDTHDGSEEKMNADELTFGYREPFPNRSTSRLVSMWGYLPTPGEPGYAQFDKFLWFLMELERNHVGNPITLVIDSRGGDTDTLEILLDYIKLMDSPVWMVARNVSSAAAILFVAGAKGHRYLFEHSQIVLHLASYTPCGSPDHTGDSVDPVAEKRLAEELDQLNLRLARLLDECTDGKILNLLGDGWEREPDEEKRVTGILTLLKETISLDAGEAKKYGLADDTIDKQKFHDLFFR